MSQRKILRILVTIAKKPTSPIFTESVRSYQRHFGSRVARDVNNGGYASK